MKIKFFDNLKSSLAGYLKENGEEILSLVGFALTVSAGVNAALATKDALTNIHEEEVKQGVDPGCLPTIEKVKIAAPHYVLPVVGYVVGGYLINKSVDKGKEKYAALSAYCTFMEGTQRLYREKVIETIGEKKEREIQGKVAEAKMHNDPPNAGNTFATGLDLSWCYDPISGRYFQFDLRKLPWLENRLNEFYINDNETSLSQYYELVGLSITDDSDSKVWSNKYYEAKGLIKIETYPKLIRGSTIIPDNTPCTVISFNWGPVPEAII